jgi:hypothetical protein
MHVQAVGLHVYPVWVLAKLSHATQRGEVHGASHKGREFMLQVRASAPSSSMS